MASSVAHAPLTTSTRALQRARSYRRLGPYRAPATAPRMMPLGMCSYTASDRRLPASQLSDLRPTRAIKEGAAGRRDEEARPAVDHDEVGDSAALPLAERQPRRSRTRLSSRLPLAGAPFCHSQAVAPTRQQVGVRDSGQVWATGAAKERPAVGSRSGGPPAVRRAGAQEREVVPCGGLGPRQASACPALGGTL